MVRCRWFFAIGMWESSTNDVYTELFICLLFFRKYILSFFILKIIIIDTLPTQLMVLTKTLYYLADT